MKKAFNSLLLIGIGLLVLSLLLNERISNLSSWYRVSLLNTYDSTIAETDGFKLVETFEKVGSKSTQTRKVYLINYIGNFTIDNINYTEDVSFHEMRYTSKKEATRIYNTLSHQPFTFKIYYDKKNPLFTFTSKRKVPNLFVSIFSSWSTVFIVFIGFLVIIVGVILLKEIVKSKKNKPVLNEKHIEKAYKLTGNIEDDYYSGAIRHYQLKEWEGFWCTIHLMKDTIVVVHNSDNHHSFREYNYKEFIHKKIIDEICIAEPEIKYREEILATIEAKV